MEPSFALTHLVRARVPVPDTKALGVFSGEKKTVKAFQKAIKRRREGKSGDDWRAGEDE